MTEYTPTVQPPPEHSPNGEEPRPPRVPKALTAGVTLLALLALLGVATIGWRRNVSSRRDSDARTAEAANGAFVKVARVVQSSAGRRLTLLGEARPYAEVTLYAKVSGYLENVRVDRGDHVHRGDVLATIQSPETDRALSAAKVEYEQRRVTADRVARLLAKAFVSAQEADQAQADAAAAKERMMSYQELQAYETLRSPLDGVVTNRFADAGALLQSAANSQTAALPVLTVSETDRLRVFVYLDQDVAADVHPGTRATVNAPEHPDDRIMVAVTRMSGTLDPRTRKMVAELDVSGAGGRIVPEASFRSRSTFRERHCRKRRRKRW